jgi:hypothetical protein
MNIVVYWLIVNIVGFWASLVLTRDAIADWRYERSLTPVSSEMRWVAIDLLVTAVTGLLTCALFVVAGVLLEWRMDLPRSVVMYWPYAIAGSATVVSFLRVFKLYSRWHLHRIQDEEAA